MKRKTKYTQRKVFSFAIINSFKCAACRQRRRWPCHQQWSCPLNIIWFLCFAFCKRRFYIIHLYSFIYTYNYVWMLCVLFPIILHFSQPYSTRTLYIVCLFLLFRIMFLPWICFCSVNTYIFDGRSHCCAFASLSASCGNSESIVWSNRI